MEQLSFNQSLASRHSLPAHPVPTPVAPVRRAIIRTRKKDGVCAPRSCGNVTEIILSQGQVENFQLLLPMLTQLNQERRWLAWIDPPHDLVSKWQKMHGIVAGELLVLRSTPDHSAQDLAERALGAGTCHAVVLWTGKLGRTAFEALQRASAAGNSHGVVLRQR